MGISTFPNVVSPIKSIQRGTASAAGNITISAVNISKTMVNSFSTSSAGTVAASGTIASFTGEAGASNIYVDGYATSGIGFASTAINPVFTGNYNTAFVANYNVPTITSYNAPNAIVNGYNAPNYLSQTRYITYYNAPTAIVNAYNSPTGATYNATAVAAYNASFPIYSNTLPTSSGNMTQNSQTLNLSSTSISGGSNNLVSAVYGVYLSNSTTLVATGPCRYEVVEYY